MTTLFGVSATSHFSVTSTWVLYDNYAHNAILFLFFYKKIYKEIILDK